MTDPTQREAPTSRTRLIEIIRHHDMEGIPFPPRKDVAQQIGVRPCRLSQLLDELMDSGVIYHPSKNCYRLAELDGVG